MFTELQRFFSAVCACAIATSGQVALADAAEAGAKPILIEATKNSAATAASTDAVSGRSSPPAPQPAATGTAIDAVNGSTPRRLKIGLALGGGGTRGAAHVGVLRVLQRENIPIDYVAGTSIGAVVGGLYCAGLRINEMEHLLLDKQTLRAYTTVPIPVRIAAIPFFFIPHIFGYRPYDGLYKGGKFRDFLDSAIPEGNREIENLPIKFCAVASDLTSGKPVAINSGNLGKAIQASSAIPFLRRPVHYPHQLLVDGAIEANLPVQQAREMGADIVIAVPVDEDMTKTLRPANFRHIFTVPPRVISMLLAHLDQCEVGKADIVIAPALQDIGLLSGKTADAVRAIKAGEEAAEAALPAIRARLNQASVAGKSNSSSTSD